MDLNTVVEIRDARHSAPWRPGDAWLGGGTYLFSGAKSMSESPFNPVTPAFANALRDAVGIRFTRLPLTRDRIWLALHRSGAADRRRASGSS